MMKKAALLRLFYLMLMLLAGVVTEKGVDEITHVDLPVEPASTQSIQDQSTTATLQASEGTHHVTDDMSVSKVSSVTISSVQVDHTLDKLEEKSDIDESITSTVLESSFTETLDTSLVEPTVTQSDDTATVVPTSSSDTHNAQNSVIEDQPVADKVEESVISDTTPPLSEDTTQAEDTVGNDTQEEVTNGNKVPEPTLEPVVLRKEPSHQLPEPGTGGAAIIPETEKTEEEGLTFNEWRQKVLAEAEQGKQAQEDTENVPLPPVKQRKRKNYASHDCGAKILTSNPEATNAKSVLNSNKDEYMNSPCKVKKWFVIELCEPIQAHSVEIACLELFSSQPKKFKIFLSDRYPTKDWKFAGEFQTKDERVAQGYEITETQEYFAKYVRVELVDHYGDEHFCPLTLFKVLGIAVVDYEDDHHGINDDADDDDDDENSENDNDEGSKNLFTISKDTVMNLVKYVVNTEPDMADININASQSNGTNNDMNETLTNRTSTGDGTLPCVPNANTDKDEGQVRVCKDVSQSNVEQPQAPEPGKTDSFIVVKLEDDEQIETTDSFVNSIPLVEHLANCYNRLDEVFKTGTPHSSFHSKLCVLTFMVYRLCHPAWPDNVKEHVGEVKTNAEHVVIKGIDLKDVIADADHDKTKPETEKSKDENSQEMATNSEHSVAVSDNKKVQKSSEVHTENEVEVTADSVKPPQPSQDVTGTQTEKVKISPQSSIPASVTSSHIEATQTVTSQSQTGSKISESDTRLVSDTIKIDPSPTFIESSRSVPQETEATPTLSEDWEPHTKDLGKDESTGIDQKTQTQTETTKTMTGAAPVNPNAPETPSVSISSESSVTVETTDTLIVDDDTAALDMDTENTDQKPNTTIIDEKVVVSNGGGKRDENINLVRLSGLSGGKRESAIMRLSNRIKVLEQNVSLSSRFLEELSRRYKKQSEDMMKMLNKTMAQLHNVTVEADVKSKIHEDEMTALESRLENLTKTVNKLTHSFDNLNQQVTDRQMIWTTIEMLIIIVILMFLYLRRKNVTVTVPSDVRALIEAMPTKPETPLRPRRNSLSGPPTPLKEKAALQHGGGLQRFSSEMALGPSQKDYLHSQQISDMGNKHGTDGVKKKKKKKHKGSDLKLFSNTSIPFYPETGSIGLRSNSSQLPVSLGAQSAQTTQSTQFTQSTNQSGTKSSPNLSQCSKSKSCFGSLLSGWNGNRGNKGRSASFDTSNDRNSVDDFLHNEQAIGQSCGTDVWLDSAKNIGTCSLGAKNVTKGPTTKKPPLPTGSKQSPKLNAKSTKNAGKSTSVVNSDKNVMELEEKWIVKGHRRQKSLPKDYPSVENIGPSFKKTKHPESLGREKSEMKSGSTKLSKKEERSACASFLPDLNNPLRCSQPMDDSRRVVDDVLMDSDQIHQCYSLEKGQSDIYLPASYGRCSGVDSYANSLNGHYNGVSYDDTVCSTEYFTSQNGAEYIENDDFVDANQLPVNIVNASSNGKWKNVFDFFH